MELIKLSSIPSPCKHRDFWTLAKLCLVIYNIDWSRGAVTKQPPQHYVHPVVPNTVRSTKAWAHEPLINLNRDCRFEEILIATSCWQATPPVRKMCE